MSNTGKIVQVIGPVVDVEFNPEDGELPKIFDALEIKPKGAKGPVKLTSKFSNTLVRTGSAPSR